MKKLLLSALALMGICATAQEKVKVHNGSEIYVTTIEYVTFDVTAADEVVSVAELTSANETLAGEKKSLEDKLSTMEYALTERVKKHDYVDLGLPSKTLWATMNVGASSAEDYGDYFAWGETVPHYSAGGNTSKPTWKEGYTAGYDWSTYKYMDSNVNDWKGCAKYTYADGEKSAIWYDSEGNFIGDNKTELEDADDVAVQAWGGKWQMPTKAMQDELRSQCYWEWTTSYNGKSVNGYIVYKAKKDADKGVKVYSGNTASSDYNVSDDTHIFLPAAGDRWDTKLDDVGSFGSYWSRSLSTKDSGKAYFLYFYSYDADWGHYYRGNGQSVRPVVPAAEP